VAHHPNIEVMTFTEVDAIEQPGDGRHLVRLTRKPTYVVDDLCIGCRLCEYACDSEYPDAFEEGLGAARAISVPFTNAIPQKAVLNPDHCANCGSCLRVCPTDAIDFTQVPRAETIHARAVVIASGYKLNDLAVKPQYHATESDNIVSPFLMERLLAPHGPFGRVLRPSDGKIPDNVAYVQCAGSRDKTIGVPYCSRTCCMWAIKQAMLLSGALPLADITIYYMDIRTFGKEYEQFYQNAKAMGISFIRGKVGRIEPTEGGNLIVRVEATEEGGRILENRHDLVVLAQGMIPQWDPSTCSQVARGDFGFVGTPRPESPTQTNVPGIFVAGAAAGPKDIVDTIVEAGAAAMEASDYLHQQQTSRAAAGAGIPSCGSPELEPLR